MWEAVNEGNGPFLFHLKSPTVTGLAIGPFL